VSRAFHAPRLEQATFKKIYPESIVINTFYPLTPIQSHRERFPMLRRARVQCLQDAYEFENQSMRSFSSIQVACLGVRIDALFRSLSTPSRVMEWLVPRLGSLKISPTHCILMSLLKTFVKAHSFERRHGVLRHRSASTLKGLHVWTPAAISKENIEWFQRRLDVFT